MPITSPSSPNHRPKDPFIQAGPFSPRSRTSILSLRGRRITFWVLLILVPTLFLMNELRCAKFGCLTRTGWNPGYAFVDGDGERRGGATLPNTVSVEGNGNGGGEGQKMEVKAEDEAKGRATGKEESSFRDGFIPRIMGWGGGKDEYEALFSSTSGNEKVNQGTGFGGEDEGIVLGIDKAKIKEHSSEEMEKGKWINGGVHDTAGNLENAIAAGMNGDKTESHMELKQSEGQEDPVRVAMKIEG